MCGSKDGLTIRQIHRIAAFRHRVVLCEACRPTATHLFPADSLWRYVHLGVDEYGYWCALSPRTTQGEGAVNAIAVAIEGTVLEYPSDILGSGRNSSIAAFQLTQFHTIEVSIALSTEVVRTSANNTTLEVVHTILVVAGPGVLIAVENGILIDGLGRFVMNGQVTSQFVVDTTLNRQVLEVGGGGCTLELEYFTIAYLLILVYDTKASLEQHIFIVGDILCDDGLVTILSDERDIGRLDIGDRIGQIAFPVSNRLLVVLVDIVLHVTLRHLIGAFLDEDTIAGALVGTIVGCVDGSHQLIDVCDDSVVETFLHLRTVHGCEGEGDRLAVFVA